MALDKSIILNNGIEARYHRIKEIHLNFLEDYSVMLVDSYVSKEIRDTQKEIKTLEENINTYLEKYEKAINNNDDELAHSIEEKLRTLTDKHQEDISKNFIANQTSIEFENSLEEDVSISNFYKLLTKFDEFKKAKKV